MKLIESDIIYAKMDMNDKNHEVASKIFNKIKNKELEVSVTAYSILEIELLLNTGRIKINGKKPSKKEISEWIDTLCIALSNYGIIVEPLTCEDFSKSAQLRYEHPISFFDSHHAAQAQRTKKGIISFDAVYDYIPEVERIDPNTI
ncbi:MAG: type II toxin-antitoxin system VapC family toxin [Methanosarcinales archaeon]